MNCYYHQSHPAVGICKNCQKGICDECAVDIGNGLACKNQCETQVMIINDFFKKSKTQLDTSFYATRNWLVILGIVLILLAIAGFIIYPDLILSNLMLIIIGVSFFGYAIFTAKKK